MLCFVPSRASVSIGSPNTTRTLMPTTRPFSRCLTICTYCHPGWGRLRVGGRPMPLYAGTWPYTSTIASSMPPHPSEIVGGGASGCPRCFRVWNTSNRCFGLCLGNPARDTQSGIHVEHRRTPELSAFVSLGIVFSLPCCRRRPTSRRFGHASTGTLPAALLLSLLRVDRLRGSNR